MRGERGGEIKREQVRNQQKLSQSLFLLLPSYVLDQILSGSPLDDVIENVREYLQQLQKKINESKIELPLFVITKVISFATKRHVALNGRRGWMQGCVYQKWGMLLIVRLLLIQCILLRVSNVDLQKVNRYCTYLVFVENAAAFVQFDECLAV